MTVEDFQTYRPVSRAKDATVEVAMPGPDGTYTVTVDSDGYTAKDEVEEGVLEALTSGDGPLQHKQAETKKEA